jgi:hypothetical protein
MSPRPPRRRGPAQRREQHEGHALTRPVEHRRGARIVANDFTYAAVAHADGRAIAPMHQKEQRATSPSTA